MRGKSLAPQWPTVSVGRDPGTFGFQILTDSAKDCEIQRRLHALALDSSIVSLGIQQRFSFVSEIAILCGRIAIGIRRKSVPSFLGPTCCKEVCQ
jgi:hypothetical protein